MTEIEIPVGAVHLKGVLTVPKMARGLVIFAHGSGSSRLSPRNTYVASVLNEARLATLLFDLLTEEEDAVYDNRFNIDLLTQRLKAVTAWCHNHGETGELKIGYFGASTGSAAALTGASISGDVIKAVVSRGGRPDLAAASLSGVKCPTLLIVGGLDDQVVEMNREAEKKLGGPHKMEIVAGATHLFEERGALEKVAQMAADWFGDYLAT